MQQDVQGKLYAQIEGIKNIPMRFASAWPTFFSFAVIDYTVNSLIMLVPDVGGPGGTILFNVLRGARDTAKFVTWGAIGSNSI